MRSWKQKLALLLTAAMLIPAMPQALAAASDSEAAPPIDDAASINGKLEVPIPNEKDAVVFNLLDAPVTVGNDTSKASPGNYYVFDESGNFTIDLDELWHQQDLFFPFEVQFTSDRRTTSEWFMTPDDTVTVGAHTFSLHTTHEGKGQLSQIGAYAGDTYVPAYPEKKEFTTGSQTYARTLLPIKEKRVYLDLSKVAYSAESRIRLSVVTGNLKSNREYDNNRYVYVPTGDAVTLPAGEVLWASGYSSDDFHIVKDPANEMVIFRNESGFYNKETEITLIVGTANQLDDNNIRYTVNTVIPALYENEHGKSQKTTWLNWSIKNEQKPVEIFEVTTSGGIINNFYLGTTGLDNVKTVQLGLTPNFAGMDSAAEKPTVEFYKITAEQAGNAVSNYTIPAGAENVTSALQSGTYAHPANIDYENQDELPVFLMVSKRGNVVTGAMTFRVLIQNDSAPFEIKTVLRKTDGKWGYCNVSSKTTDAKNGIITVQDSVNAGSTGDLYALALSYKGNSYNPETIGAAGSPIVSVVKGHFNTKEEIEKARASDPSIDLKQLFIDTYSISYNEAATKLVTSSFASPLNCTVLTSDGKVNKLSVQLKGAGIVDIDGLYFENKITADSPYDMDYNKVEFPEGTNVITRWEHVGGSYYYNRNDEGEPKEYRISVNNKLTDSATYRLRFAYMPNGAALSQFGQAAWGNVAKAVVGHYDTIEAASAQPDIKQSLFAEKPEGGYAANFSGDGVPITVFVGTTAYKFLIKTTQNMSSSSRDIYFNATGLKGLDKNAVYVMDSNDDSYFVNGFQTLLTTEDVDLTKGVLTFEPGHNVTMYSDDGGTSAIQESDVKEVHDFSSKPVSYFAVAENKQDARLKNYSVSIVKKTPQAKLFVNGPDERVVFLNDAFDNHHDIFIANVGGTPLENVRVELVGAKNVKLDEYWTIKNGSTMAAFTTADEFAAMQEDGERGSGLPNIAKIRLVPDGTGDSVEGTLNIYAGGKLEKSIKLTGIARNPKITIKELPQAVKYVPYGALIMTDNIFDWVDMKFTVEGDLPKGRSNETNVTLSSVGELYGVPEQIGEFPIKVTAEFTARNSQVSFASAVAEFTLKVLDNTDENVENATDPGYEIIEGGRIPDIQQGDQSSYVLHTNGSFDEFVDLWLDGQKLVRGVDYTAEPSSISSTLTRLGSRSAGVHTIAAESKTGGSSINRNIGETKVSAQNFTITSGSGGGSSSGYRPSGGSSSNSGGGSSSGSSYSGGGSSGGGGSSAPALRTDWVPVSFTITANKPANGKITLSHTKASRSMAVAVTLTPDNGYRADTLLITDRNGNAVPFVKAADGRFVFIMPLSPIMITATFVHV